MSVKQEKWRRRWHILWRMRGFGIPIWNDVLTPREEEIIYQINNLIERFKSQERQSSEELGFHTSKRCSMCGKIVNEDKNYCKDCIKNI